MRCHYHPRVTATSECSVCGVGLCRRCIIQDRGGTYCDGCYASAEAEGEDENRALDQEEHEIENEDYIDLELMDLLDTENDEGLF